ncbi:hypothetical protein J437_LFUL017055, partial [Ladona fulva]
MVAYLVEDSKNPNKQSLPNMERLLNLMQAKGDKGVDYAGLLLIELCEKLCFMNNGKEAKMVDKDLDYILSILKFLDLKNIRISTEAEDALLYFLQPKLDLREIEDETKLYIPRVDSTLALSKTNKLQNRIPHPFLDLKNIRISTEAEDALLYFLQPKLDLREIEDETKLYIPRVDSTLALSKTNKLQNRIPHPREMALSELELHLVELRSKGLNERGLLRRLLQKYCRLGNLNKALNIKQALESQGHSFSAGMLSSLLDLYVKQNMLEESEEMLQRIRKYHPKFKLDDHKVLDIATLLSKYGRIK